jgi:hypothetical protein
MNRLLDWINQQDDQTLLLILFGEFVALGLVMFGISGLLGG